MGLIGVRRISGISMSPSLNEGDYIITISHPWQRPKRGDVVVVAHPQLGEIVKRILHVEQTGGLWLEGDNPASMGSEKMGRIDPSWIRGKLLYHCKG